MNISTPVSRDDSSRYSPSAQLIRKAADIGYSAHELDELKRLYGFAMNCSEEQLSSISEPYYHGKED